MNDKSKQKSVSHRKLQKLLGAVTAAAVVLSSAVLPTYAQGFPDVEATGNPTLIEAANTLSSLEVFMGSDDGNFLPNDNITRAEMAAVIGRLAAGGLETAVTDDAGFDDVDSSCFASGYIKTLREKNFINGMEDGLFYPNNTVTYNEFITVVVRLIESYSGANVTHEYPTGYIEAAKELGIINDALALYNDNASADSAITRGAAAIIVYNTLDVPLGTEPDEPAVIPAIGLNTFAMKMNSQMDKNENYMFSPMSIKMALAMAANGADGATKSELVSALGIDNLENYNEAAKSLIESYNSFDFDYKEFNGLSEKLNSGSISDEEYEKWLDMNSELNRNEKAYLRIANSVWVNEDYKTEFGYSPSFKPEFEKIIKDKFDGTSEVVNNSNAVEKINTWTSDKTNGKIPSIIEDPDFLAALINAIYFNGKWSDEFSENATETDTFNNADGTAVQTDFMNDTRHTDYYADSKVQMIKLPYKGNNAAMYISIDDGSILDYDKYFDKLENTNVDISMPKFKIEYSKELSEILGRLGVNLAFSDTKAEFPNMLSGIPSDENVYIDKVLHKTYISVDEKGTEAAAVTAVMMAGMAVVIPEEPVIFKADKPFTFIIRDEKSGEIIFIGRYSKAE